LRDLPLLFSFLQDLSMPELSRFFGIIISMYYNDHPPPHFHVRYGQQKAIVSIQDLAILEGKLSARVWNLVLDWASLHQAELMKNWNLARQNIPLDGIEPLE
jgi:Domain of unknown function (DUF4160)